MSIILMCPIVSVSVARTRFYRLSASRSSSLHKAPNLFLSLSEQSLNHVLEDENGESVMVGVCVCECVHHVYVNACQSEMLGKTDLRKKQ